MVKIPHVLEGICQARHKAALRVGSCVAAINQGYIVTLLSLAAMYSRRPDRLPDRLLRVGAAAKTVDIISRFLASSWAVSRYRKRR